MSHQVASEDTMLSWEVNVTPEDRRADDDKMLYNPGSLTEPRFYEHNGPVPVTHRGSLWQARMSGLMYA